MKAVVLLSGGLDSTTCLAYAKQQGFDCYALSFNYDQRHAAELDAARVIATHYEVVEHLVYPLNVDIFKGSALTDKAIAVPCYQESSIQIPSTYVPARNTVFLSIALAWAEVVGAHDIFIGVSSVDYSNYADCRPEFIAAFQVLANKATKCGVEGQSIQIRAPLQYLSKAETIALGRKLGVDYAMTTSCYQLDEHRRACGYCDSCVLRRNAFLQLNLTDPTLYK